MGYDFLIDPFLSRDSKLSRELINYFSADQDFVPGLPGFLANESSWE